MLFPCQETLHEPGTPWAFGIVRTLVFAERKDCNRRGADMNQEVPVFLRSTPDEALSLPAAVVQPGLASRALLVIHDDESDQLPAARGLAVGVMLSALLWMPVALAVWAVW